MEQRGTSSLLLWGGGGRGRDRDRGKDFSARTLMWSLVQLHVAREGTSIIEKMWPMLLVNPLLFGIFELKMFLWIMRML